MGMFTSVQNNDHENNLCFIGNLLEVENKLATIQTKTGTIKVIYKNFEVYNKGVVFLIVNKTGDGIYEEIFAGSLGRDFDEDLFERVRKCMEKVPIFK